MATLDRELTESESLLVTGDSPLGMGVGDADLEPMLCGIRDAKVIFFLRGAVLPEAILLMFSIVLKDRFFLKVGCSSIGDIGESEARLLSSKDLNAALCWKCCTTSCVKCPVERRRFHAEGFIANIYLHKETKYKDLRGHRVMKESNA